MSQRGVPAVTVFPRRTEVWRAEWVPTTSARAAPEPELGGGWPCAQLPRGTLQGGTGDHPGGIGPGAGAGSLTPIPSG